MKKILKTTLIFAMVLLLITGCGNNSQPASSTDNSSQSTSTAEDNSQSAGSSASDATSTTAAAKLPDDFKIGIIFIGDENSTYDKNFMMAMDEVKAKYQLKDDQILYKTNVKESSQCYEAAVDLADRGCKIIIGDSFGHEQYLIQAAKEFPEVQFFHCTGNRAHTEGLDNVHNAFASIYQGRYLSGVAAGMKLNQMIKDGKITEDKAKLGYVGAYTYAEVISGYTSFYLGAKSVCPSVTMEVQFTGSWFNETAEKETANKLIADGCVLISQHADSMGAPTACEQAKVPNVCYNITTEDSCPGTFLIATRINWEPYFSYIIDQVAAGKEVEKDWCHGFDTGSVEIMELNEAVAAPGTKEKLEEVKAKLVDGSLNVFDTANFTVDGKKLDSYLADVDLDPEYKGDTEVIKDGVFHESEFRSAPYFDLRIDGIKLLNEAFQN